MPCLVLMSTAVTKVPRSPRASRSSYPQSEALVPDETKTDQKEQALGLQRGTGCRRWRCHGSAARAVVAGLTDAEKDAVAALIEERDAKRGPTSHNSNLSSKRQAETVCQPCRVHFGSGRRGVTFGFPGEPAALCATGHSVLGHTETYRVVRKIHHKKLIKQALYLSTSLMIFTFASHFAPATHIHQTFCPASCRQCRCRPPNTLYLFIAFTFLSTYMIRHGPSALYPLQHHVLHERKHTIGTQKLAKLIIFGF